MMALRSLRHAQGVQRDSRLAAIQRREEKVADIQQEIAVRRGSKVANKSKAKKELKVVL